jgi:hypothetical protein
MSGQYLASSAQVWIGLPVEGSQKSVKLVKGMLTEPILPTLGGPRPVALETVGEELATNGMLGPEKYLEASVVSV